MIAELRPYPETKRSGVSGLGDVPDHWDVQRLKQVCRLAYGDALAADSREAGDVPVCGSNGQVGVHSRANTRAPSIVIGRKGSFGKVNFSAKPVFAIDTTFFIDSRTSSADLRWLAYVLGWLRLDDVSRDSAIPGLDRADAYQRLVPRPPGDEQAAIVRFLDHADARIRRYIRAKKRLIELLEEQKQAIIHRAVTRRLDPVVRLKPSGVEWLGDVPEHWEVTRLGRLIELLTGFPFKSEGFTQDETGVRLLRGVNIAPGRLRWADVVWWPRSDRGSYSAFELLPGDIVLGMDRPIIRGGTRVARVSESDCPALLLQRVARIRPKGELCAEFLTSLLAGKSFADYLRPIFTGISVPHLSPEQIKAFRIALPPMDEQREVVLRATEETRRGSIAVSYAEREIELLREYRIRLIADVVTGKRDVREAAAALPDESDVVEEIDEPALGGGPVDGADDLDELLEEASA